MPLRALSGSPGCAYDVSQLLHALFTYPLVVKTPPRGKQEEETIERREKMAPRSKKAKKGECVCGGFCALRKKTVWRQFPDCLRALIARAAARAGRAPLASRSRARVVCARCSSRPFRVSVAPFRWLSRAGCAGGSSRGACARWFARFDARSALARSTLSRAPGSWWRP